MICNSSTASDTSRVCGVDLGTCTFTDNYYNGHLEVHHIIEVWVDEWPEPEPIKQEPYYIIKNREWSRKRK